MEVLVFWGKIPALVDEHLSQILNNFLNLYFAINEDNSLLDAEWSCFAVMKGVFECEK